jgi:signal transduction histidine kinase
MAVILDRLESAMLATLLGHELDELVVELSQNPEAPMPETASVKAYLLSREHLKPIPDYLRSLSSNVYHKMRVGEEIYQIAIVDLTDDRMYLSFDVTAMSKNQSILLVLLVGGGLLSTIILVVSGFWLFRKFLLPVSDLAEEVSGIDPNDRNIRIEDKYLHYEVGLIAHSIDQFLDKLDDFVEREQSFTAAVSHELRTPVAVVATATDLLEVKGVTGEQQEVINRIKESTTYMANVIEALLFFARDTRQSIDKTMPEISLAGIFIKVLRSYKAAASEKKVHLRIKIKTRLKVRMSESHVEIILGNLIRNAIDNTDAGEVKVTIFEKGFSVKDSGRGIEPDDIELIVKRSHHSADSSGFGLGLYLVKSICDIYELKLEIESEVDEGSEFLIYFPENMLVKAPASE